LSTADVAQLAQAGLIRPCKTAAADDTVIAFSVVDKNNPVPRRWFVSWPCGSNRSAMESGYMPSIPLHHISSYLGAVNTSTGCLEHLLSGFDQIALPPDLQDRFVFTDAASKRWCLTRQPMAHTGAAEILHMLFATVAGHPKFALLEFLIAPGVRCDLWVSTARFSGAESEVRQARAEFREACKECGVTLQSSNGGESGVYTFAGVRFDHLTHTVSVEPELMRRITPPRLNVTTRNLGRQYTQLLFSSAVLNVAVSSFYKLPRTMTCRLSLAMENPETLLQLRPLPQDSYAQLETWYKGVIRNMPRFVRMETLPCMTLFLEVSGESWFAVLIGEETQETWNTGDSLEDVLGNRVVCACISRAFECL
jgi:hypothetical protein